MKRKILGILTTVALLAGCNHGNGEYRTIENSHFKEEWCFVSEGGEMGTDYLKVMYEIEWPKEGQLPEEVVRGLAYRCFEDSNAVEPKVYTEKWLEPDADIWRRTESIDDTLMCGEVMLGVSCSQQGRVLTYDIVEYECGSYAAHGIYGTECVTIDLKEGKIVSLEDLVDIGEVGRLCWKAVEELEINAEAKDGIFPEEMSTGELPVPRTFYLDTEEGEIMAMYGLYEIGPFSSGEVTIGLPADWLEEQGQLTQYARELLKKK